MKRRDFFFWRWYIQEYGLTVNEIKLTCKPVPSGDTPETDKMVQMATTMGSTIDAETIERYRNIERGRKTNQ